MDTLYLDRRTFVNGTKSILQLDNILNLNKFIKEVIDFYGAVSTIVDLSTIKVDTINPHTTSGIITIGGVAINNGGIVLTKGTVTQITSITTGVTVNEPSGKITTVSSTLAANASAQFTVTNSFCTATSVIVTNTSSSGTGKPHAKVVSTSAGSFVVQLENGDASVALNAAVVISFIVA